MNREQELGRLLQEVGRRMEDRGQVYSQRFHDWHRVSKVQQDSTRGGGGVEGDVAEKRADRLVGRLRPAWLKARNDTERLLHHLTQLMDQGELAVSVQDKHRTPAQVEADGFCGNHWHKIGVLEPITTRPSGEPYYSGSCRFCGSWPGGMPPVEVLQTRHAGKAVRVAAS